MPEHPPDLRHLAPPSLLRLVSPHVGPIRWVRELATPPDHARLAAFVADSGDLRTIHGCRVRRVRGSALQYDRRAAVAAAIGEAVERYCGAAAPDDLVVSSASALGSQAVSPGRFVLFHSEQYHKAGFPYRPFLETTPVRWVSGVDLQGLPAVSLHGWQGARRDVCLPAQLVYLAPDHPGGAVEEAIGYGTSSGMACAPTAEQAVLAGLLELVERDAVMLAWYLRRSPPHVRWRGVSALAAVEDRCFTPTGLRYVCLDLSDALGVATVLAVVSGGGVGLALGAGCALTPEDAWLKAMREAFATYAWADRLRRLLPPIPRTEPERVGTFADHVRFYADPENASLTSFLWEGSERRDISQLPRIAAPSATQQIAAVHARLDAAGASAYAVDLTTSDIRRAGLHVWKVLSPELQPLDVGYAFRFLGLSRFKGAALRLVGRSVTSPDDLNRWPHPFP